MTRLSMLAVFAFCVGCGTSNPVKDTADAEEPAPEIIVTNAYLPVEEFDKEGLKLPYESAPNPYAEQKGRIKKESVALYIEARRAYRAGKDDQAVKKLEALVASDSTLSGPWVMLGDIAVRSKDLEQAQTHFEKALAVNPDNVNALLRLAHVFRIKGEFILSQNVYAQALALWKDFPEAHLNLAILYDVYMDKPMFAQQHMEAYQFLTSQKDDQVAHWLEEIRSRTGVSYSIKAGANENDLSMAGEIE